MKERFSTQEIVIGKEGQKKLSEAAIAIVGLGALGSLSAQLLARAGIGKLILIDKDRVEEKNLHRQFYTEEDIGKPKAFALEKHIKKVNSKIKLEAHAENLNNKNAEKLLKGANVILDCVDNLEARFLINDFSIKHKIPFVHATALAERGYVYVILPKDKNRPCFECIHKGAKAKETTATAGVINIITAAISVLQVNQAMKIILEKPIADELFYFNTATNTFEKIKAKKNPKCDACSGDYKYLRS